MIIRRINSLFYWVGEPIPEIELVGGKKVHLRDLVVSYLERKDLTKQDVSSIKSLIQDLEKREKVYEHLIRHAKLTHGEAKKVVDTLFGIMRAVDELRSIEDNAQKELQKETLMKRVEDEKRWLEFTKRLKK